MLRNHKPSGKHTYDITQDVTTDGACSQVHGWRSRPSTTDRSGKGAGPTYQQCFQRADSVQQLRVHICAAQVFRSTIQILHRLPQLVDRLLVLQKHLVRQLLLSDGNANSEEAHAQSTPVGACYSQGDTPTVPCAPHLQHALLLAHATSPPIVAGTASQCRSSCSTSPEVSRRNTTHCCRKPLPPPLGRPGK